MAIDALILDLGNVLAFHDNAKLFHALAAAFRTTPEAMSERLSDGLWERVNRGQLPGDALRAELARRLEHDLPAEEWFALWNCHFTLNRPMIELVEQLVGTVKLALLSNTHDQHVAFLRPQLPVLERFDALVLSYEEGLVKPEARIYERALQALHVAPQQAAFFDDVQRYADAASAVGIHGRLFTTVDAFREALHALGVRVPPSGRA